MSTSDQDHTRYRELAQAGSDWHWETDAEHRFVLFSGPVYTVLGVDPEQIIGKTRFDLADIQANPELWRKHREDLDNHRPFRDLVYSIPGKYTQDAVHYLRINGKPRFSPEGHFLGYRGTAVDVSAEELSRRRAQTAEQRFINAMESIYDAASLYDADGRFVVCNAAWRDRHVGHFPQPVKPGCHIEKILRAYLDQGIIQDAVGQEEKWLRERLENFHQGRGHFQYGSEDGRWMEVRDHRIPNGSTIVTTRDITEHKLREDELRCSELRFRAFAEAASDWYWETDAELNTIYLSDRYTEITGRPREQRLGRKTLLERPEGIADADWQQHQEDVLAHRPFRNLDYQRITPDGDIYYHRINGIPVFDDHHEFQGYRGTGLDNSKEIQVRQTEERFRDVIEAISDSYALFDTEDHLLIFNHNWLNTLAASARPFIQPGISFGEVLRMHLECGYWPRAVGNEQQWRDDRLRYHRECAEAFEHETGDGHWYMVRERRTRSGGVLLTAIDITEHKRREQALERSESRFRDFAETAADWFWELDSKLHVSFVSDRFNDITGISIDPLQGAGLKKLISQASVTSLSSEDIVAVFHDHQPIVKLEFEFPDLGRGKTVHSISGLPLFNPKGEFLGYRGTGRNITQARELSAQLAYQASHDELTGLVNRREFEHRLTRVLAAGLKSPSTHALCYLDLDQFKVVNDTSGHAAGDALLQQLSALLSDRVRGRDTLARLGGDEFALLLEHCTTEQAVQLAHNLLSVIETYKFTWHGKHFRIGVSIGLVPIDNRNVITATEVLRAADSACYMAKDLGRNRIQVYTLGDTELALRENEMQWVSQINEALAENRFVLYAQTIKALNSAATGDIPHYEILLRMRNPKGDIIPPGAFLPAAERYSLATRIDRWVVTNIFKWIDLHPRAKTGHYHFNINLAAESIGDENFQSFVIAKVQRNPFPAQRICFEITETTAIANLGVAQRFIHKLREQGCRFALDDFGSGLSSYAALRDLPVDYLKIDGSFIRDGLADPVHLAMVRSINDIGHVMGKQTVAEYVQDQATADKLAVLGVDFAQGFGIDEPWPLDLLGEN